MSQGYVLKLRQRFGEPMPLGVDPASVYDPPPRFRPFEADTVEAVIRDSGMPMLVCGGACPSADELDGWLLVMTSIGSDLLVGGVHPRVRAGVEAPFQRFIVVPGTPASLQGLFQAAGYVDVYFVDAAARPVEDFVFAYVNAAILFPRVRANRAFSERRVSGS